MKRAGDSSYNILGGQGKISAHVNDAIKNGTRSTKRSLNHSDQLDPAYNRSLAFTGNAKTFHNKRLSNNPDYKNQQNSHLSRAASALDATQIRSTPQSAFTFKQNKLDRANRSGFHKNQALLQSHYGLSGNNSAFAFQHGKKIRGLNSGNHKQLVPADNDHSALKQFAIEQLSLITQSQYREEEKERQNIILSDRPGAKTTYGKNRSRPRRGRDEDGKPDPFAPPFMLSKAAQRADNESMYLRSVEKQHNQQLQNKQKFQPYQQQNLHSKYQQSDSISHSGKSEGRAQKNLEHFRQLSRNAKKPGAQQEPENKVEDDNVEPKKSAGQNAAQEVETTRSTAAQSSEIPKNNLLRQMSQEKAKAGLKKAEKQQLDLPYKKDMQKQYLCRQIRDRLRKEFFTMFRNAETAYAALDYTGTGHISQEAFMNCQIVNRLIPFTNEQVKLYFMEYNLFGEGSPGLDFDTFKKNFFPHLYLVGDPADDEADKDAAKNRDEIKKHGDKYNVIVEKRIQKLEAKLKEKFSNCFESVRKAFLALDADFDGFITVEDILKYFATDTDLNYNELKKLLNDKDSKKEGRLNYPDFSKWLGNTIHMPQGFYFRHDSVLNPAYELQRERQEKTLKAFDRSEVSKILLGSDLENQILEKIKFQWKTIRKAFQDMNVSKTGKITEDEFKYFLQFWGMTITEQQFKAVFDKFDLDGDGALSYKDFQQSIGAEMFPAEGLYFRQDKAQQCRVNACKQSECWEPTKNTLNYCDVHQKMHQDHAVQNFSKLFRQIGHKWSDFVSALKRVADSDDESQIAFNAFVRISKQYGSRLRQDQFEQILMAFPGKEVGDKNVRVNIGRIYDQKYNQILQKVYDRMDFAVTGGEDEPIDQIGYIGQTLHERGPAGPLKEITHSDFIRVIHQNNKLKEIMFLISQVDNHTGCVTKNELDDIVKLNYPNELKDKNLIPIISMFSSLQNKILIDHQKFRDWILKGLAKIELKLEKKRLMNKQYAKPNDSQVTALDLMAQQTFTMQDEIKTLEKRLHNQQQNLRKLERSESQKPGLTQELLQSQFGASRHSIEDENYKIQQQMRRPAAGQRPKSSMYGSKGQDRKLDMDLNDKTDKNSINNNNIKVNIKQKYLRRPLSSIPSSAYNSRVTARNLDETASGRRRGGEYVTIKDLIQNDNQYGGTGTIDETKKYESQTRNNTSNTIQPTGPVSSEYNTGQTSQKYTTNGSGNMKRRPYSSIHGLKRGSIDMNNNVTDTKDQRDDSALRNGGRSVRNFYDNGIHKNSGSLQKTRSESKLMLDAYTNSRLCTTSDQMMRRLMNYNIDKEPIDSQRQTIDRINDYKENIDEEEYNFDDERDILSGGRQSERSQSAKDRNYDSRSKRDNSGSAMSKFRRSESVNRAYNRTITNDSRSFAHQRPSSIEVYRQPRDSTIDTSQFARFMRIHTSLNVNGNQSRSRITPTSFTPKHVRDAYYPHQAPTSTDKQTILNRAAYEWKNIYRNLFSISGSGGSRQKHGSTHYVSIKDFDGVCQKFKVNFTKEELNRIETLFSANSMSKHIVGSGAQNSINQVINFVAMSHVLGLHRDSYNHLGAHTLANERSRSIFKQKQIQQSIAPVEEEVSYPGSPANDYGGNQKKGNKTVIGFSKSGNNSSQYYKLKKLKKELSQKFNHSAGFDKDPSARNRNHLTSVTEETMAKFEKESNLKSNREKHVSKFRKRSDIVVRKGHHNRGVNIQRI